MHQTMRVLLAAALSLYCSGASSAEPLPLESRRQPLNAEDPAQSRIGQLIYRGGIEITSSDRRFGGLSGLSIGPDGRAFLAVTDEGNWIAADLVYDEDGRLVGLSRGRIGALADLKGRPLKGKRRQDAESLARLPNNDLLVAFEHDHRLWRYAADGAPLTGAAMAVSLPAGARRLPDNAGVEALTALADGRILALAQARRSQGVFRAFLWRQEAWKSLSYPAFGQFRPTGAAALPNGGLIVLERSFSYAGGIMARVMKLELATDETSQNLAPKELALLKPPLTLDNFEGVDARLGREGETLIYLLSDDNFSFWQRSLLLQFELKE